MQLNEFDNDIDRYKSQEQDKVEKLEFNKNENENHK